MVSKRRIQGTIRKVSSGLKGLLAIVGLEGVRTGTGSDRGAKLSSKQQQQQQQGARWHPEKMPHY